MASQAQIDANRENAFRSTGPKTEAGKAKSSRNAARHGILASVIPAETPGYREMLLGLYEGIRPVSEAERLLIDQIAVTIVRLQRCMAAEQRAVEAAAVGPNGDCQAGGAMAAYLESPNTLIALRYEASLNRLIQRNFRLLRDMKSDVDWKVARHAQCPYIYRETVAEPPAAPAATTSTDSAEAPQPARAALAPAESTPQPERSCGPASTPSKVPAPDHDRRTTAVGPIANRLASFRIFDNHECEGAPPTGELCPGVTGHNAVELGSFRKKRGSR